MLSDVPPDPRNQGSGAMDAINTALGFRRQAQPFVFVKERVEGIRKNTKRSDDYLEKHKSHTDAATALRRAPIIYNRQPLETNQKCFPMCHPIPEIRTWVRLMPSTPPFVLTPN